jgi:hypothetical protein
MFCLVNLNNILNLIYINCVERRIFRNIRMETIKECYSIYEMYQLVRICLKLNQENPTCNKDNMNMKFIVEICVFTIHGEFKHHLFHMVLPKTC